MAYFRDGFGPMEKGLQLEVLTSGALTEVTFSGLPSNPVEVQVRPSLNPKN